MRIELAPSTRLADVLFSPVQQRPVQQRVLALLFGQPCRSFQSAEVITLAGSGTDAVHRQLIRLADSGLVTVTRVGNQKHYQANRDSPVFSELHGLVVKTIGLAGPLEKALAPFKDRIQAAFVYGSIAKGTDTAQSDIDLMVICDDLAYSDLYSALQKAAWLKSARSRESRETQAEIDRLVRSARSYRKRSQAIPWHVRGHAVVAGVRDHDVAGGEIALIRPRQTAGQGREHKPRAPLPARTPRRSASRCPREAGFRAATPWPRHRSSPRYGRSPPATSP